MWGDGGDFGTWAQTLERWQAGEHTDLASLPKLDEQYFSPATWARLTDRIVTAINRRLHTWGKVTSREIGRSTSEFAVGSALTQARVGLRVVLALADHPSLPADLRQQLTGLVVGQVQSVQDDLERSLDDQSSRGVPRDQLEARRRTVRSSPLTAVLSPARVPVPPPPSYQGTVTTGPGGRPRRVLHLG